MCTVCHGPTGEGTQLGQPFPDDLELVDIIVAARGGVPGTAMPPFGAAYSLEELHDVASYIERDILSQQ